VTLAALPPDQWRQGRQLPVPRQRLRNEQDLSAKLPPKLRANFRSLFRPDILWLIDFQGVWVGGLGNKGFAVAVAIAIANAIGVAVAVAIGDRRILPIG
jgi:hypothetical protein